VLQECVGSGREERLANGVVESEEMKDMRSLRIKTDFERWHGVDLSCSIRHQHSRVKDKE
jgi:hypothetical protein